MLKSKKLLLIVVCGFIIFSFLMSTTSFAADKPATQQQQAPKKGTPAKAVPAKPVTLKGVIQAAETDESGQAVKIHLAAGEQQYPISMNEKGKELLPLVGKTVEINGGLKPNKKGKNVIAVKTFKVVE